MGTLLMENFNVAAVDALASRGITAGVGGDGGVSASIVDFTEDGNSRKALRQSFNTGLGNGAFWAPHSVPITVGRPFFFSMRLRAGATVPYSRFYISLSPTYAQAVFLVVRWIGGTNLAVYPGPGENTAAPGAAMPVNTFLTLEGSLRADGTALVWVNDMLLYAGVLNLPLTSNRLYFGCGRALTQSGFMTWDVADLVLVDPATPGLQNRPGSTGRVRDVPFTSDVKAEWVPPAGVVTPHYQLMKGYSATVNANELLTGTTLGMQDVYANSGVPGIGNHKVLSVGLERRIANTGGVPHSVSTEIDVGAGFTSVGDINTPAGVGYQYAPLYLDKKPDGTNWSAADVAAMKAGITVKS